MIVYQALVLCIQSGPSRSQPSAKLHRLSFLITFPPRIDKTAVERLPILLSRAFFRTKENSHGWRKKGLRKGGRRAHVRPMTSVVTEDRKSVVSRWVSSIDMVDTL